MADVSAHPVKVAEPGMSVAAARPKRFLGIDDKFIAPILITCILLVGHAAAGILKSPARTLLAIGTSIIVELVLGYLFTRKWPHWASAYISGISVGILVQSTELWPYALCAALAITSKYAIRVKGRHIWNPSNFAICVMLIIAREYVATLGVEFGNAIYAAIVIWLIGSLIISRLKRFHICLTYAVSFLAFAALRTVINSHGFDIHAFAAEISPITGPMYQLFIFFMITDPKTTVKTKRAQTIVAFLVAAMECVLRLMGDWRMPGAFGEFMSDVSVHAPYYALTIVGPIAMLWQIWQDTHKSTSAAARPRVAPANA
jgi:hypothetical protein